MAVPLGVELRKTAASRRGGECSNERSLPRFQERRNLKLAIFIASWIAVAAMGAFEFGEWTAIERSVQPNKTAPRGTIVVDTAYLEGVIQKYIEANPDLVGNAIKELLKRQEAAKASEQARLISSERKALFDLTQRTVLGDPDADTTLVEFFDYNCPHCRNESVALEQLLQADNKTRIILKEFPILGEDSTEAARISLAVATVAPAKYREFQHKLLNVRGPIGSERALEVAAQLDVPREKLLAVKDSNEIGATISQNLALGKVLGITGTPSFVTPTEVLIGELGSETLTTKIAEIASSRKKDHGP